MSRSPTSTTMVPPKGAGAPGAGWTKVRAGGWSSIRISPTSWQVALSAPHRSEAASDRPARTARPSLIGIEDAHARSRPGGRPSPRSCRPPAPGSGISPPFGEHDRHLGAEGRTLALGCRRGPEDRAADLAARLEADAEALLLPGRDGAGRRPVEGQRTLPVLQAGREVAGQDLGQPELAVVAHLHRGRRSGTPFR